jgi:nitroimidazol reductase NimA-like FMN-containing flavoprotein (pyridoxamine 5'-phosphate oxidase superfamily)
MTTLLTDRTRVRRLPNRGSYDRATVNAVLDAGFVCHVGFIDDGQPYVIPTGYARADDRIYIHGSTASRMVQSLGSGIDVCVTVTLVDGFVLARSAFHHSVNYRSVIVFGRARAVTDPDEKLDALRRFTNHLVAGRFEEARRPTEQELKATAVLALALEEASAKVRTGPPVDDEEDYALQIWAGVIPLVTTTGEPVPDKGVGSERQFDDSRLIVQRTRVPD